MRISTKGKYGLRAMVDLAVHSADSPIPLSSILIGSTHLLTHCADAYSQQRIPKDGVPKDAHSFIDF